MNSEEQFLSEMRNALLVALVLRCGNGSEMKISELDEAKHHSIRVKFLGDRVTLHIRRNG